MKKKCIICGKIFETNRKWQKCCYKEDCRKKATSLRVVKHRKKHLPLKIQTIREMKSREPYKTNYEKIITALTLYPRPPGEDQAKKLLKEPYKYLLRHKKRLEKLKPLVYLKKETGLSYDILRGYILKMNKLGVLDGFNLSERHELEALKLRQKEIIMEADMKNIYRGSQFLFYLPNNISYEEFIGEKKRTSNKKPFNLDAGRIYLFETIVKRFLSDLEILLLDAKASKAEGIWNEKINNNKEITFYSKIFLRTQILVNLIIRLSPMSGRKDFWNIISEKKFIEIRTYLQHLILVETFQLLGYNYDDVKEMAVESEKDFNAKWDNIADIYNEVYWTLIDEKEYVLAFSPPILNHLRELNKKVKPDFLNFMEKLDKVSIEKNHNVDGEINNIKKNASRPVFYPEDATVENLGVDFGRDLFNKYDSDLQNLLQNFCGLLGYDKKEMYRALALFSFPLPLN